MKSIHLTAATRMEMGSFEARGVKYYNLHSTTFSKIKKPTLHQNNKTINLGQDN